jgi:hypothetical protein
MAPLPVSPDLRSNLGTWAVPSAQLPAVARFMLGAAPTEGFDPLFQGQDLETTYLDTTDFALRKARRGGQHYLTLRLRCYGSTDNYALSAKTELDKWRSEISHSQAQAIENERQSRALLESILPANLLARLQELTGNVTPGPVVTVYSRRYAVEDDRDRYTLDCGTRTDTGLCLPGSVLEFKSTAGGEPPPPALLALGLRRIKLSKFLWASAWTCR